MIGKRLQNLTRLSRNGRVILPIQIRGLLMVLSLLSPRMYGRDSSIAYPEGHGCLWPLCSSTRPIRKLCTTSFSRCKGNNWLMFLSHWLMLPEPQLLINIKILASRGDKIISKVRTSWLHSHIQDPSSPSGMFAVDAAQL